MGLKEVMKADSPGVLWMMDESGGATTIKDYGTGAHDLTNVVSVAGAGPGIADSVFGRVFRSYDATNGAAYANRIGVSTANSNPTTGTWTVWLWLETTGGGVYQSPGACFTNTGNNGGNWDIEMDPAGSLLFGLMEAATGNFWRIATTPTALPTGRWLYIAAEYDNATGYLSLFVDNVMVARNNTIVGSARDVATGRDIRVGGFSATYPEPWKGKIGPFAIFPTILGAKKTSHYDAAFQRGVDRVPMRRRWRLR